MKTILSIDTSSRYCSLALCDNGKISSVSELLDRSHTDKVLPMIDVLYRKTNLRLADTDLVCFAAGPGSFTGVRLAASISQAIALASNSKVVPIGSSEVLCASYLRQNEATQKKIICVQRSRANIFYISAFRCRPDGELEQIQEDRLFGKLDGWLKESTLDRDEFVVLGDLPDWFPNEASERHVSDVIPDAGVMIEIGNRRHEQNLSVEAELALPIYVEGDTPWKKSTHTA
ncbi:MAG TPA: tRNA (adenosine(37)-N6)-threonylcarbamoyltransferase complex dimerization subunit type 1 TsaB [Gammaproteobacteria bacterium]|nr:tRNA (adenosine(37)-N6)-threonylcarbamoyltransferase complex dimerization subunit type 1 TsaB [Gammaproteobacteria bacterium]